MYALICCAALLGVGNEPFDQWVSQYPTDATLPKSTGTRLSKEELKTLQDGPPVTPFSDLNVGIRLADGTIWAGSPGGLMCLAPKAAHWKLFHSRRWLPDDHVLDLAIDSKGVVLVKTRSGTAQLTKRRWTLDEKMASIQSALEKYHLREGFCCEISLNEPGKVESGYSQPDSDNDGLWTALYVGAEAFRYGATGSQQARDNAWKSLKTMMRLEQITGIPGFIARSFVPIEIDRSSDPNWHQTPDGKWWWKDDTSSDEVDGHFFAYAIYYLVAATDQQKAEIRPYVTRIMDHILDHGYYYVGPTGRPTTWGFWAPERLNQELRYYDERGLNSMEILSHLKVAEILTGNPRYAKAAQELIEKHGYAINTVDQKLIWPRSEINHSDDELAFVAYYPLVWLERNPKLRRIYLASITRSYQIERPEVSPFFNFIYAAAVQANTWTDPAKRPSPDLVEPARYDRDACLEWFRLVPTDLISWTINNSKRRDIGSVYLNRFQKPDSTRVFPIDERLMLRWNADPYELDNGDGGHTRGDGAFILLPYWMGRYHRFIP